MWGMFLVINTISNDLSHDPSSSFIFYGYLVESCCFLLRASLSLSLSLLTTSNNITVQYDSPLHSDSVL